MPQARTLAEALFGGVAGGLDFYSRNVLPQRQQEERSARADERLGLEKERFEETKQQQFVNNLFRQDQANRDIEEFDLRQTGIDRRFDITQGGIAGRFGQTQGLAERRFEHGRQEDITDRRETATPTTTTPEGIPLNLLETITKEGLRGFKTDEEMEASLDFIRRALGLETAPRRQPPQQQPEELDFIDRIFKAGSSIGDIFTGGEQALQAAPSPRRTEGTIDQLERLFPVGDTQQDRGDLSEEEYQELLRLRAKKGQ